MSSRLWGTLLFLSLGTGLAHAQTMRSFSAARQVHGETNFTATIRLASGTLRVAPGGASLLYNMEVVYDADRFKPLGTVDQVASDLLQPNRDAHLLGGSLGADGKRRTGVGGKGEYGEKEEHLPGICEKRRVV